MYKKTGAQLSMYDYVMPFDGVLDQENRWMVLASEIDWVALEDEYSRQFKSSSGNLALPARMAFATLVIREALGLTDAATMRAILESPYLQYFIGLNSFTTEPPFSARSIAGLRKRFAPERVSAAARRLRELTKGQGKHGSL